MSTTRLLTAVLVVFASAALLVCLIFGLYALTGGGSFEIRLPAGYSIVRAYGNNVALCAPPMNQEVVEPSIDGYCVVGSVVVGHVVPLGRPGVHSVPGYFLVDTRTGDVHKGLTEAKWAAVLSRYGISTEPRLRRPIRPLWPLD